MKLLFLFITILIAQDTIAGTETGNGGDPAQVKYLKLVKGIIREIKDEGNRITLRDIRKYDLNEYLDLKNVRLVYPKVITDNDGTEIKCLKRLDIVKPNPNSKAQLLKPLYATKSGQLHINGHCWRNIDNLSKQEKAKFRTDVFLHLVLSMITFHDIELVYIWPTKEPIYDGIPKLNYNDATSFIWQIWNLKTVNDSSSEYSPNWFNYRRDFIAANKKIVKMISPKVANQLGIDLSLLMSTTINEVKVYPFLFQDEYGSSVSAVTEEGIIKLSDDQEQPFPFCDLSNFNNCDKIMHLHEVLRLKGYDDNNFYLSRKLLEI